jgi:hypothetical protein
MRGADYREHPGTSESYQDKRALRACAARRACSKVPQGLPDRYEEVVLARRDLRLAGSAHVKLEETPITSKWSAG